MLQIKLLGDFRLGINNEPVTSLKSPRFQALIAYLLLHRDAPQRRQHVAFLFWPDSTEEQAQTNLRKLLMSMRRAFPALERYIALDRRALQWNAGLPYSLDVADFERAYASETEHLPDLRAIVDLYGGDLLPGCYDEWIAGPRERLRQHFLEALQRLVSALQSSGEIGSAILYARRLLRHDPLQEENYRRLMQLYAANGDDAAALGVYRQCESFLRRELGVEPSAATLQILRQLTENDAGARAQTGNSRRRPGTRNRAAESPESPATRTIPNNLPAPTTLFIGREREISVVSDLLRRDGVRLISLTGTGGTGKTRLALQVATSLVTSGRGVDPFRDGIYFVPLASVEDASVIPSVLALTLGVAESGNRSVIDSLFEHLREKSTLLVLDNFEHLLVDTGASASPSANPVSLVSTLLSASPQLKVLVTSRATLNISGEHEYSLASMPVPGKDMLAAPALAPEELAQYESVALFVVRAQEVSPGFSISRANARAVSEICRRLEGLPLAIELAAAMVRVLSPEAILSRLDRRLKLLVGGKLDLPLRQRTLEAAIAWSYNLLDANEQALFRMLAVFSGGFTLEAVEGIGQRVLASPENTSPRDSWSLIPLLTSLVSKSLVVRLETYEDESRFSMLDTIREYAEERLQERGDAAFVAQQHALYYAAMSEAAAPELIGPHQSEWMAKLESEHDNLRAALRWSVEKREVELALRLSASISRFWEIRGYLSEGRTWLRAALDLTHGESTLSRASALYSYGSLAVRQRDYDEARPYLEECRTLYKALGDKVGLSNALNTLAVLTLDSDYEDALALHQECLALRREIGDRRAIASSLHNIAFIMMHQGRWDEAQSLASEVYGAWKDLESPYGVARAFYLLGMIGAGKGDLEAGYANLEEGLQLARGLSDDWLTAWILHAFGEVLYGQEQYERSTEIFAEAATLFAALGDRLGSARTLISQGREAFRSGELPVAETLFHRAIEIGISLDNHVVIGCCLAGFAALAGASGRWRLCATLFGCSSDLLVHEFTSLERCAMTLNLASILGALSADEATQWEADWYEGSDLPWQEAFAQIPHSFA